MKKPVTCLRDHVTETMFFGLGTTSREFYELARSIRRAAARTKPRDEKESCKPPSCACFTAPLRFRFLWRRKKERERVRLKSACDKWLSGRSNSGCFGAGANTRETKTCREAFWLSTGVVGLRGRDPWRLIVRRHRHHQPFGTRSVWRRSTPPSLSSTRACEEI